MTYKKLWKWIRGEWYVKKTSAPKKPRSHPLYVEMISKAITILNERTGSNQVAIAKFIKEKQKDLPLNFRKLLLVRLKKLVASGKLTKIKNFFKVTPVVKPVAAKPKKTPAIKKKPTAATTAGAAKAKPVIPKKKIVAKKPTTAATKKAKKLAIAPAKAKKTPAKKVVVVKVKKTPKKKIAKKPKTIKTHAKKAKK